MNNIKAVKCTRLCLEAAKALTTMSEQFTEAADDDTKALLNQISTKAIIHNMIGVLENCDTVICTVEPSLKEEKDNIDKLLKDLLAPKESFFGRLKHKLKSKKTKKTKVSFEGTATYNPRTNILRFDCKRNEMNPRNAVAIMKRLNISGATITFSDD